MVSFEKAIPFVLKNEGGLSDRPIEHDKGGLTKYGISSLRYPKEDIRNLTIDRAKYLYKRDYWDENSLGLINDQNLSTTILDFVVNSGGGEKVIQKVINENSNHEIIEDGAIGPITISKINTFNPKDLGLLINAARYEYVKRLDTWIHNSSGWTTRIKKNIALFHNQNEFNNAFKIALGVAGAAFLINSFYTQKRRG